MKKITTLLAVGAFALVAACNNGATTNGTANGSAGNSAAGNTTASAAGNPVTAETLAGTWGQDNCSNTMTFNADGTASSTGATSDNVRWTLDGSTIVITAPGQPETRMPATINGDNLNLSNAQGQNTVMNRCGAAGGASGGTENAAAGNEAAEEGEAAE